MRIKEKNPIIEVIMKRVDQEGGQRLIEHGVSPEKFDPSALPSIKEFEALSTTKGCKLIEAVRSYTETPDKAFDIALALYRENITGFEILSVNPEWVDYSKVKMLYEIQPKKSIWESVDGIYKFSASLQFAKSLYDDNSESNYDDIRITGETDVCSELGDSSSNSY
jgi:hypothetical protein